MARLNRRQETRAAIAAVAAVTLAAFGSSQVLVFANPAGGTVVRGNVTLPIPSGTNISIIQNSSRAVINWDSFSIDPGESVNFVQANASYAILNRVTGGSASGINGTLTAQGNVFLLNPNGILIGPKGYIDTGGFVASTLDVDSDKFMAGGDLTFEGSSPHSVVNMGTIIANSGDVFLIAKTVENTSSGLIQAPNGRVGLAAGTKVLLTESGEERVFVQGATGDTEDGAGVLNSGTVEANVAELKAYGGNIYGMAVKNEGRVAATSVSKQGGQIFLRAQGGGGAFVQNTGELVAKRSNGLGGGEIVVDSGEGGFTEIAGDLDASGLDPDAEGKPEDLTDRVGGQIWILGQDIEILGSGGDGPDAALILVDGDGGAGNIFIGGGHLGQNEDLFNATMVNVGSGALLSANAQYEGDGGNIVVFALDSLTFAGEAQAKGGLDAGNGGQVELSGQDNVTIGSLVESVDVSAINGQDGTLLLDPSSFEILFGTPISEPTTNSLYADDVSNFLASGSLQIRTSGGSGEDSYGDIFFQEFASIEWSSPNNLTFVAFGDFYLGDSNYIESLWSGIDGGGDIAILSGGSLMIDGGGEMDFTSLYTGSGTIKLGNWNANPVGIEDSLEFTSSGVTILGADIHSETGDIEIDGKSRNASGVVINESTVSVYNDGSIMIKGSGGLLGEEEEFNSGVDIVDSSIMATTDGFVTIKGSGGDDGTGVRIANSEIKLLEPYPEETEVISFALASIVLNQNEISGERLPGEPGTIAIEGIGGEGDSNGLHILGGSEVFTSTDSIFSDNLGIYLSGQGQGGDYEGGTGYAILIEEDAEVGGPVVFGEGTPLDLYLRTLGGMVSTEAISGNRLFLSDQSPNIEDFLLLGTSVDFLTSSPAGDITIQNEKSLTLGDIGSAGTLMVEAYDEITVEGTITAGTKADLNLLYSEEGEGLPSFTFGVGSSITAPDVYLNGVEDYGGMVGAEGDLDITNFHFNDIFYVEGLTEEAKLIASSAAGQKIRVMTYQEGDIETGIEMGSLVYIDGLTDPYGDPLPFVDFSQISGGRKDDTFTVDIEAGNDFEGMLFGGEGNDEFIILPTGGGIAGTVYGDNGPEFSNDGIDTLNYSNFTEGFTIVYNQQTAPAIGNFAQVERVIGSAGIDTLVGSPGSDSFKITGNNAGRINDGFFESFEILMGGNGNDTFEFLNQATVNGVLGGIGSDLLWINDSNLGGANTYTISSNKISRNPTYNFGGIEVVQINFGPGDDTVITGPRSFIQLLNGGDGYDTIQIPGQTSLNTNPIVLAGGQPIAHTNFENPPSVNPVTGEGNNNQNSGNILTLQIGNNPQGENGVQIEGEEQNNYNSNPGQNNGGQTFQGNVIPGGGGAFSAAISAQANVITVDGTDYLVITPTSLDGTFTLPPIVVVNQLSGNLEVDAFAELADAIGYDGPMLMVYTDGPFAIDLSGPPDAAIAALLQGLLDPNAAAELYAALGLQLVMPVTSEDGVVSMLTVPVQPNAVTIATLAELINDAAFGELSSALDGE